MCKPAGRCHGLLADASSASADAAASSAPEAPTRSTARHIRQPFGTQSHHASAGINNPEVPIKSMVYADIQDYSPHGRCQQVANPSLP